MRNAATRSTQPLSNDPKDNPTPVLGKKPEGEVSMGAMAGPMSGGMGSPMGGPMGGK